ncbi:MAG: hypothetical protein WCV81_03160 [Microgenomates group bacterium]|jgi:hypothetical protein
MPETDRSDHSLVIPIEPDTSSYTIFGRKLGHNCGSRGLEGLHSAFRHVISEPNLEKRQAFIESFAESAAAIELGMAQDNLGNMHLEGPTLNQNYDLQDPVYRGLTLAICDFLDKTYLIATQNAPQRKE